MQYTSISGVWNGFIEQCGSDVPLWEMRHLQARIKQNFPGKRYEEITAENISTLVQQMWDEAALGRWEP